METKTNHAIENAKAWMGDMAEMISRLDYEGASERDTDDIREAAREAIAESPLSVGVRASYFHAVGETSEPNEFEILLSTGGPALRIIGNLDDDNQPVSCRLEWQDWGTPWTYFAGYEDADRHVIKNFAQQFYFGD